MSAVKDWGARIARELFENHKTVSQVVNEMNDPKIDKQWYWKEVEAVARNPRMWGYNCKPILM